jgi:3',5'-cyclic AMP phosphodiesterase CpdA
MSGRSLLVVLSVTLAALAAAPHRIQDGWTFVVSGDSRNCGDVVMPSIAEGARKASASFYWHLGDLRHISDFDQDFKALHPDSTIMQYISTAWDDFIANQIEPFQGIPFYLGIGNHELLPPKTRQEFILQFADWLDAPVIREQRLKDDPHDHALRTYYHWQRDGIDFIYLDNAGPDQFDKNQLGWMMELLTRDEGDSSIRAVVIGMHEALPDSIAHNHSMNDSPLPETTGRAVYQQLLALQKQKPVYVLASHSHFYMEGIFNTAYLREHGGILPGWIVGTAGAVRYKLPENYKDAKAAHTKVYGYLLATVRPSNTNEKDPIWFEFREVKESEVPSDVVARFGKKLVHECYVDNAN